MDLVPAWANASREAMATPMASRNASASTRDVPSSDLRIANSADASGNASDLERAFIVPPAIVPASHQKGADQPGCRLVARAPRRTSPRWSERAAVRVSDQEIDHGRIGEEHGACLGQSGQAGIQRAQRAGDPGLELGTARDRHP